MREDITYKEVNDDVVRTMTETSSGYYALMILMGLGVVLFWGCAVGLPDLCRSGGDGA